MKSCTYLAILIATVASIIELIGAYMLLIGWISQNLQAIVMTITGVAAIWIAILLAYPFRRCR